MEQDLNPVTSFPTEQEQGGLVWVHRKFIPDNAAETIDGLAHISCAAHDIDVVRHGDIAWHIVPLTRLRTRSSMAESAPLAIRIVALPSDISMLADISGILYGSSNAGWTGNMDSGLSAFGLKFKWTTSWAGDGAALEMDSGISRHAFFLSLLTQL